jgi:signal transduction histidine kinase
MPYYDIITLIGFGFGAALSITLFSLSLQRVPKRAIDIAFGILFLSFVFWFGGHFLSLLLDLLFGSVVDRQVKFFYIFAYFGLAITPSALLHIQLASLISARGTDRRIGLKQIFIIILFYIPFLFFVVLNAAQLLSATAYTPRSEIISTPFTLWLIIAIIASVTFSEKLVETLKYESDRRFYRDISYVLAVLGFGIIAVYIFSAYKLPYIGELLDLLMMLSPAVPMAVFLYYVYRYNFYRLVIKPSLVYSVIYGSVMAIYLLGIRRLGEFLSQFPEVNEEIIEGLLLIALVFAFQPFRTLLQTRLDKLFFKDRYYYQQFLRELSDSISSIVDLDQLLNTIRRALKKTLKVKECTIIILQKHKNHFSIIKKSGRLHFPEFDRLIEVLRATQHFRIQRQMSDFRVSRALEQNNLALAVPVFFQDELRGVIGLDEKEAGSSFTDEELNVLQTFANQIGLALENARLVQERVSLVQRVNQAEKINSLGQLATTMSHEIKNPLTSIKTIVQVLHENATGEEQSDLRLVLNEINRLQDILEKLLSFARPQQSLSEWVNIEKVVSDVVTLLNHQAQRDGITLRYQVLQSIPLLEAKQHAVREIIFNLVLNAVQAVSKSGHVTVTLDVKSSSAPSASVDNNDTFIRLTVTDDGPGIAEDMRDFIFEPFYTSKTVGTGLGLAIVKRNIEELAGDINVHSDIGKGTTFEVLLPSGKRESTSKE